MSKEKENKLRTLDEASQLVAAGAHSEVEGPRFVPSLIAARGYENTRIRRYQRNQSNTVIAAFSKFEVFSLAELREKIGENALLRFKATQLLQSCLVGPPKNIGPAQLFRKGDNGLSRMVSDLTTDQIMQGLTVACNQVKILQEDTDVTPAATTAGSSPAVSSPTGSSSAK